MEKLKENQIETLKFNVSISYGIEQEIQRVRNTLKRLPWYLEQGYSADFAKLPAGITEKSNDEDVIRAVNGEYFDADYAECAAKLQQEWAVISKGFEKMRNEPSFHLSDEYSVVLTKYGSGGSYDTDKNWVIVRAGAQSKGGTMGIVVHEIVHITIQYLIDKYHIRHWHKERLVDLILERYFSGLKNMQNTREDISMVDQAFEKLFPDMEAVAKSIGE